MTVSVQTLAGFLLARIAEDEAAMPADEPRKRSTSRAWWSNDFDVVFVEEGRFRAECSAKRRIVEWHAMVSGTGRGGEPATGCANCIGVQDGDTFTVAGPCLTLRLLALPYADHADYRAEWRP